jgi:hypothetical protein
MVPHPKWGDVYDKGEEPLTDTQKAALDDYLKIFALAPRDDIRGELCPHCFNHAAIEWGLQNGEAFCINCGWPYRVYHRDIGGTDSIRFLNCGLPYHPSCVASKSTEEVSDE